VEGGADTYEWLEEAEGGGVEVYTEVANLEILSQTLKAHNFKIEEVDIRWIPENTIEVSDIDQAKTLLKLMDALESLDDVQNVTANFEFPEGDRDFSDLFS